LRNGFGFKQPDRFAQRLTKHLVDVPQLNPFATFNLLQQRGQPHKSEVPRRAPHAMRNLPDAGMVGRLLVFTQLLQIAFAIFLEQTEESSHLFDA